jgi:hypothetical protein
VEDNYSGTGLSLLKSCCFSLVYGIGIQIGLETKNKHVEDATETVQVTEEVDEEQQIEDEVLPCPLAKILLFILTIS